MSRRQKHVHEEEHENHERWLVTYADMITLLMVLFIVMFAMSSVDQKKFNALKEGLAAGFGQSTSVLDGSTSILSEPGLAVAEPINPRAAQDTPEIQELKAQAASDAMHKQNQQRYDAAAAEADRLVTVERRLLAALREQGLADDVATKIDGRGLTVSLVSRHVVFEANLADLTERGRRIVDTLAPVLSDITDKLQIEGHTNQAPGTPKFYASDWDLSTARAVTVLRHLNERRGVPAGRLAAVGFGHIKPLVDPATPGSQQLNKRVDIVVMSTLAEENAELLDRVMDDRSGHTARTTSAAGGASEGKDHS
jgi:chemotaxis protein MotB